MKRSPLKRSTKDMAYGGLSRVNKAEAAVLDKLLEQIGCAVCFFRLRIEGSQGEIHHLLSGGKRMSHYMAIPLCASHHRGVDHEKCILVEPGFTYRHSQCGTDGGLAAFETAYGDELELMFACGDWINDKYWLNCSPDGLLTDEQAPQGNDHDADTDADLESNTGDEAQGPDEIKAFTQAVRLDFVHYRYKLADPDGLSVKAVIDGIVEAGLLRDDSAKEIDSISHKQVKISRKEEERTVLTIEEVAV